MGEAKRRKQLDPNFGKDLNQPLKDAIRREMENPSELTEDELEVFNILWGTYPPTAWAWMGAIFAKAFAVDHPLQVTMTQSQGRVDFLPPQDSLALVVKDEVSPHRGRILKMGKDGIVRIMASIKLLAERPTLWP